MIFVFGRIIRLISDKDISALFHLWMGKKFSSRCPKQGGFRDSEKRHSPQLHACLVSHAAGSTPKWKSPIMRTARRTALAAVSRAPSVAAASQ
jgi:hypothetical protein